MSTSETLPRVPIEKFGKDHWSTFAYLECRVVDNEGMPNRTQMRCDPDRHPAFAHSSSLGEPRKYPTRIADGESLDNHDDWDCVDDMEAVGLVKIDGTGVFPVWSLTDYGSFVAAKLRAHKGKGGNFSDFRING